MKKYFTYIPVIFCTSLIFLSTVSYSQKLDATIQKVLPKTLKMHRELVSIPNVASDYENMYKNLDWVTKAFENRNFKVRLLKSSTLPVFLAEKNIDKNAKTVLFYIHLDGQPVNPEKWDQEDPFKPVLKEKDENGHWQIIDWKSIDGEINPEWRIFGRAAADDKAPITMMLMALDVLESQKTKIKYNIKVILDCQEEAGSEAFLSTLEQYKKDYAADNMIIFDGPVHPTNKPTLTFGCRGNAKCSITTYGAKFPLHSGHYGNYSPNPVFSLSHLLASMKDKNGRVSIEGYYDGIEITPEIKSMLELVPDDEKEIQRALGINKADNVGRDYQESLQYPSLNVRHIETSWKGPGLKTVVPEIATAHIDVRLVVETDGAVQLEKIRRHLENEEYLVLDRDPTDKERLNNQRIVKFIGNPGINAFRTEMDDPLAQKLMADLEKAFGEKPVTIRTMGGTIPIVPAINTLNIPAIIVPMVNMDNNQHSPNENIRIGNLLQGVKICTVILSLDI